MAIPRSAFLIAILAGVPALPRPASADGWQNHFAFGGEINADPHGVGDFGVRKGPFSIQLFTDTLELRYQPESPRGRWWLAARGEALAAGLMLSPWTDGAPDPRRALLASYGGL